MSLKKITPITDADLKGKLISGLADRPNMSSRYGDSDLTAAKLKERFDAVPTLLKNKINAIAEILASPDASKYIALDEETGADNLYDFLALFGKNNDRDMIANHIYAMYAGRADVELQKASLQEIVNDLVSWLGNIDKMTVGHEEYDLVITSDEEFSQLLYPLFKDEDNLTRDEAAQLFGTAEAMNEPQPFFHTPRVLVKNVVFTERRGYDDIRLHIFHPSIRYIKFEGCTWHTSWRVSGARPLTLKTVGSSGNVIENPSEFNRAPKLHLTIDGLCVTEENVCESIEHAEATPDYKQWWGIGLRNLRSLVNSDIVYPSGYRYTSVGDVEAPSFKLTLQYFDHAENCRVTALWDGDNASGCTVSEGLYRMRNVCNVTADPLMDASGTAVAPLLRSCDGLSNLYGDFKEEAGYPESTRVDDQTCTPFMNRRGYELIVSSNEALEAFRTSSADYTGRRILFRNCSFARDYGFKNAAYVGFDNCAITRNDGNYVEFSGARMIDGVGLSFVSGAALRFKSESRMSVYNVGTIDMPRDVPVRYIGCNGVFNSSIHSASGCYNIANCFISAGALSAGTVDNSELIHGIFTLDNTYASSAIASGYGMKFVSCEGISHIHKNGNTYISFENCSFVDYLTVEGVGGEKTKAPFLLKDSAYSSIPAGDFKLYASSSSGNNVSKTARKGAGEGYIPIRDIDGHINLPIEKIPGMHQAMSLWAAKQRFPELSGGKIPAHYLPSYVDDVIEGYYWLEDGVGVFSEVWNIHDSIIPPEKGKIYVDLNTSRTYRWSGSTYICISSVPIITKHAFYDVGADFSASDIPHGSLVFVTKIHTISGTGYDADGERVTFDHGFSTEPGILSIDTYGSGNCEIQGKITVEYAEISSDIVEETAVLRLGFSESGRISLRASSKTLQEFGDITFSIEAISIQL